MMNVPILTTNRLVLRKLRQTDAADVLVFRGDPEVQRYDDPPLKTVAEARAFISDLRRVERAGEVRTWAITFQGIDRVIGLVTLQRLARRGDAHHRRAEVGYGIARARWGQGIASEAVRAVLGYAFETLELNRVYARTIADNRGSVRLLERLGFVREGLQREHSLEDDGHFHDSAVYGLLRRDWGYPPLELISS